MLFQTEIAEEHLSTIKRDATPLIECRENVTEEKAIIQEELLSQSSEIFVKPEFVVTLYDATVQEGERYTFECRVTGHPRPNVSWLKDGMPIVNNPDYLTKHHQDGLCSLTIEETFAEDTARFSCVATNAAGSTETKAVLNVKGAFSIFVFVVALI